MNKCEHGQKITCFCASECCVWKEAAGCQACMKKYHNHMGTTVFLGQEDVTALVKKYTMDSSIKPKCRVLQQAIYAYFNLVKTELSNSLDAACKNIINQIGYPYLYTNGTLSTYKRLKNKEYKKLIQKDFRALYELSQKINEKDLAREEAKIYVNQMKMTEQLIGNLDDLIKKYESSIKKYHPTFSHDTTHIFKINQIFKNLSDSPRSTQLKSREEKKYFSPVYPHKDKMEKNQKGDGFKIEPVSIISSPTPSMNERMPTISAPPYLARPKYSREVSLDQKIVHESKFGGKSSKIKQVKEKQAVKDETRQISLISQKNERMQVVRQELNNKQQEINEKKKMLMEMMKTKQDKPKDDKVNRQKFHQIRTVQTEPKETVMNRSNNSNYQSKESALGKTISESKQTVFNRPKVLDFASLMSKDAEPKNSTDSPNKLRMPSSAQTQKQENSNQELSSQEEGEEQLKLEVQNHAFTQLPFQQKIPKTLEQLEPVKEKLIVIPTSNQKESYYASPLYKIKTILDKYKDASNMSESRINRLIKGQEKQLQPQVAQKDQSMLDLIPIYHKKTETQMELKENEEKSLALLLKSLQLKAEEAIVYLQKAIMCADNNLSAAEYLSFLYLELDRPSQCLKLCNKMLDKLENSSQPEELSLILNNNKASALNILGRYSESIVLLEKCLRYREKDYFFKNLGDAYYSISIYEKAIYNYEKCLNLNDHHDEAHYNLAVCLYIQENYQFAKLSILKAIEINSANENYHELSQNIDTRINNY